MVTKEKPLSFSRKGEEAIGSLTNPKASFRRFFHVHQALKVDYTSNYGKSLDSYFFSSGEVTEQLKRRALWYKSQNVLIKA